jgi:putative flippase GtrA
MSQAFSFTKNIFEILKLPTQFIRFIFVGIIAAIIHFSVAMYVSHYHPKLPFISNAAGFSIAFIWSYIGQRLFTFRGATTSFFKSFKRWLIISLSGFGFNQGLLWLFYHIFGYAYPLAVGLAIVIVACLTFLAGKFWAFATTT